MTISIPSISFNIFNTVSYSLAFCLILLQAKRTRSLSEGVAVVAIQFFCINLCKNASRAPGVDLRVSIRLVDTSINALYSAVSFPFLLGGSIYKRWYIHFCEMDNSMGKCGVNLAEQQAQECGLLVEGSGLAVVKLDSYSIMLE